MTTGEEVAAVISRYRFAFGTEDLLQAALAATLAAAGFAVEREVRLSARDRIDLLVDHMVGVEVKIDGSSSRVIAQLRRYADHETIDQLVLVTRCARHVAPPEIDGVPVTVVNLAAAGL